MFRFTFAFSIVLLCSVARLHAQSSADPLRAALLAATQKAALESEGSPPFHLEAKYETFDYTGQPLGSGTLTEEFLRPGLHKVTVQAANKQASADPPDFIRQLLFKMLIDPGPTPAELEDMSLTEKDQKAGEISLRCITLHSITKPGTIANPFAVPPVYCLGPTTPIFRVAVQRYGLEVLFNKIGSFAGHSLAQDISIKENGKLRGKLQVTQLVTAPSLTEANFPTEPVIRIREENVKSLANDSRSPATGRLIQKVSPFYPAAAKIKRIQGPVVLNVLIDKQGLVKEMEIISAPSGDLAEAAKAAVRQWRYEPYLLNGQTVEAETTVTVNFSFGG